MKRELSPAERRWRAVLFASLTAETVAAFALALGTSPLGRAAALALSLGASSALLASFAVQRRRHERFILRLKSLAEDDGGDDEALLEERGRRLREVELLELLEQRLEESATAGLPRTGAELHALQNQINPHFLYNTLEIIRSRALVQGCLDVPEMVESLALQFRYCINSQGEMATLRQELAHVRNYLLIQRYRFGDRIRYKEVIHDEDDCVLNSRLPILTLQPIIENALIHGVNPRVEGGSITLRVRASDKRLYISVEDDGVGIPEEALKRMRQSLQGSAPAPSPRGRDGRSSGIAMGNVNRRIRLCFGEHYGVDVASTAGVGTSVFITLPLVREI